MAAYALGRAPYPGVGGYSGECVLFLRLRSAWSLFTRLRLKMREEKKKKHNYAAVFFGHFTAPFFAMAWELLPGTGRKNKKSC